MNRHYYKPSINSQLTKMMDGSGRMVLQFLECLACGHRTYATIEGGDPNPGWMTQGCDHYREHLAPPFVDICQETAYGSTVRLPFQIRGF
jgi:hypothetical protein